MTLLWKKHSNLLFTSLLLFGINILMVLADDCSYFLKATSYMGDEIRKKYENVVNCCEYIFGSNISCKDNRINKM